MAKGQTSKATNIADTVYNQAQGEVNPVITNANQQQQKLQGQADQTLKTQQGQQGAAQGTYQKFMDTGGFSPTDETTYLNRATQGVGDTYKVLTDEAERRRAASGGLGTGGEIGQLARQGTQQQALATENAQADLHQQENANKLAGAGGMVNLAGQNIQLFNSQTGAATAQGKQILDALGLKYSSEIQAGALLEKLSKDPTTLQQWLQLAGPISGALQGAAAAF